LLDKLPADLKADRQAARALPPGGTTCCAQGDREAARDGEYGAGVEKFAEHRQERRRDERRG